MKIVTRQQKNRNNEKLYIFEFETTNDFKFYIAHLYGLLKVMPNMKGYIDKMKARCDSKYAREGVACSFALFESEFLEYTMDMTAIAEAFAEDLLTDLPEKE